MTILKLQKYSFISYIGKARVNNFQLDNFQEIHNKEDFVLRQLWRVYKIL